MPKSRKKPLARGTFGAITCPRGRSTLYWNQIIKVSSGIAQPGVKASKMISLMIPLPPLSEQHRIVTRIESLFEKLDRAKELMQSAFDSFENRLNSERGKEKMKSRAVTTAGLYNLSTGKIKSIEIPIPSLLSFEV